MFKITTIQTTVEKLEFKTRPLLFTTVCSYLFVFVVVWVEPTVHAKRLVYPGAKALAKLAACHLKVY